jgi:SAM-dependent methyltransferase
VAVEFDSWADIYDIWIDTASVSHRNLKFYVDEYLRTPGPVVELGVGNGRIALEAASRGKAIVGVDSSSSMLAVCRERAAAAGVSVLINLMEADLRNFVLPEPAALITMPFHTIGHLLTYEDKAGALEHIYQQLAPGGRLIFDHFVFDPEAAHRNDGATRLRAEYADPRTGLDALLWFYQVYNFDEKTIRILAWTDEIGDRGFLIRRRYRRLEYSWIEVEDARSLVTQAGFEVEALYGDFDRSEFTPGSREQIWVARKPSL